jgi:putative hydrolase
MLKIDLHLHTIASGHAYNTILEYVDQAKKLKMKMIGFADHGPSLNSVLTNRWYFENQKRIPKIINGIRILKGIEANIINAHGDLDISDKIITEDLDYVIAYFHMPNEYKDLGVSQNTEVLIKTMKNGKVNIISHPFAEKAIRIDIEKISRAACFYNVLLEVNLGYISNSKFTTSAKENLKKMIAIVKKNRQKIIINSDAHSIWEMADDSILKKYNKEIGLDNTMIINNYPKELMKILKVKE